MTTDGAGGRDLLAALPDADEQRRAGCTHVWPPRRQRDGILDVAYRTVDTPLGTLLLAATEQGLVRVAYAGEGHDAGAAGSSPTGSAPGSCGRPPGSTRRPVQLDEYFAGRRRAFDLPLDLRLSHGFRRTRADHLREIGYGATASYAAMAALAGHPRRSGRSAPPARPTRCRWWCPATGWSASTAAPGATSAGPRPSSPCSGWSPRPPDAGGRGARPDRRPGGQAEMNRRHLPVSGWRSRLSTVRTDTAGSGTPAVTSAARSRSRSQGRLNGASATTATSMPSLIWRT